MSTRHLANLIFVDNRNGKVCSYHTSTLRFYFGEIMKHGLSRTRLYGIWKEMKKRCYCQKCKSYKNYGGRGIIVCSEWLHDFKTFYDWAIAKGYDETLSIERLDVNGNYEPSNCCWATRKEQANNKRNNRYITVEGETMTIAQCAEKTGLKDMTLRNRLKSDSFVCDDVFRKPVQHAHLIEFNGMTKTLRQWSIYTGINYRTLYKRIFELNWDITKALTTR